MIKNEQAILKLKAHLHMVYGLANDLNGETSVARTLMKHYGDTFNHITIELLPKMGMTNDEIVDFVTSLDADLEVFGATLPGA
jgi:hypothetical protein